MLTCVDVRYSAFSVVHLAKLASRVPDSCDPVASSWRTGHEAKLLANVPDMLEESVRTWMGHAPKLGSMVPDSMALAKRISVSPDPARHQFMPSDG